MIKAHLAYLRYVLRHKLYVFQECLKYGLLWQGITHDWSKFLPSEWVAYAKYFYGTFRYEKIADIGGLYRSFGDSDADAKEYWEARFNEAWNHHQKRQPHHWQYWLIVNPVVGKCYNANDKGGYCQCLNSRSKTLNFVQSAALCVREKISIMADSTENFAESITSNLQEPTKMQTETESTPTTARGTQKTPKPIETDKRLFLHAQDVRLWSIMEETHRLARAAGNLIMSFWHLTISKAGANNGGKWKHRDSADSKPTDGQSTITFPRYSVYCATTVIHPMDTMGIVRINDTKILIEDSGKVVCLECDLPYPKEGISALPMPDCYRKEMLSDWRGAGRAINGVDETAKWYVANKDKMQLHPDTRRWVEKELAA